MSPSSHQPEAVLNLWFPDSGHQNSMETHGAFWDERMQGGMDETIISQFEGLTLAAATGALDHWAETPRGRLALLIALDQFPRSLWRDTAAAFGQDIKAARLAIGGIKNGSYDTLEPWEQAFFVISITHCEGPDHLERMLWLDGVVEGIINRLEGALAPLKEGFLAQHQRVKSVIETFGRHPHRNGFLGRASTPAELAYIAEGDFPHLKKPAEEPAKN